MTAPEGILHLSDTVLSGLDITTAEVIAALESVIRGATEGTVWAAPKAILTPPDGRYIMATLAAMSDPPLVVTKSLVLNANNSEVGLPQINGLIMLLDGETGVPVATIDGNWITAIRTAGLSAVAARYLARKDAKSVGFVGSGLQARSHLTAFVDMFPLKSMKIYGRGRPNIDALCKLAAEFGLSTEVCATAREAVENVDLVVTSVTHTGVAGAFLDANWLAPGSFATAVDLGAPWHKASFGSLDQVCVDDLEQEASLSEKLADPAHVGGDLSGLVTGRDVGRSTPEDRTAFVFRGHALGDVALAALSYSKYRDGA